jgi:hypothetical protein
MTVVNSVEHLGDVCSMNERNNIRENFSIKLCLQWMLRVCVCLPSMLFLKALSTPSAGNDIAADD